MVIDTNLIQFATDTQKKYVAAVNQHGSIRKAATALNVHNTTISRSLQALKNRSTLQGYSPEHGMTHVVPDLRFVGKITDHWKDGELKQSWVRSDLKAQSLVEVANVIVDSLIADLDKKHKPIKAPKQVDTDLLTVYPMGDPHLGMYADAKECGEAFNCKIAEHDLYCAVDYLVDKAPSSEEALITNLGDFFHSDTSDNRTRRSGNALDVDGRWTEIMGLGVQVMTYVIDRALQKHKKVTVINEIGNHDDQSAYMMSLILSAWYRNEPRVHIDTSPMVYHYYRFGKVFIGVTHGNNAKPDALGQVMAVDKPHDWGTSEFRYWYVGHIHHDSKKEVPGVIIESFRTLAAKDAYHAAKGYRSGRDMKCIIHHKDFGEVGRHRFDIAMVKNSSA